MANLAAYKDFMHFSITLWFGSIDFLQTHQEEQPISYTSLQVTHWSDSFGDPFVPQPSATGVFTYAQTNHSFGSVGFETPAPIESGVNVLL